MLYHFLNTTSEDKPDHMIRHGRLGYGRKKWILIFSYLQERLNQVVNEKKKESRSGMEIMNLLQVQMLDELPFVIAS